MPIASIAIVSICLNIVTCIQSTPVLYTITCSIISYSEMIIMCTSTEDRLEPNRSQTTSKERKHPRSPFKPHFNPLMFSNSLQHQNSVFILLREHNVDCELPPWIIPWHCAFTSIPAKTASEFKHLVHPPKYTARHAAYHSWQFSSRIIMHSERNDLVYSRALNGTFTPLQQRRF